MGDYSHLTVEHSAMLLREHGSFCKFSNQGFEAKHKDDRRTYSRATNHNSSGEGQSSESQFNNYCFCQTLTTMIKDELHDFSLTWLTVIDSSITHEHDLQRTRFLLHVKQNLQYAK